MNNQKGVNIELIKGTLDDYIIKGNIYINRSCLNNKKSSAY